MQTSSNHFLSIPIVYYNISDLRAVGKCHQQISCFLSFYNDDDPFGEQRCKFVVSIRPVL